MSDQHYQDSLFQDLFSTLYELKHNFNDISPEKTRKAFHRRVENIINTLEQEEKYLNRCRSIGGV